MDIRRQLLDLLEFAYQTELAFAAGLTEEERALQGSLEQWAPKDILPHCAEWKERGARNIRLARIGQPAESFENPDAENAAIFERHRNDRWPHILGLARHGHLALVHLVDELTDDELQSGMVSFGEHQRPYWRVIVGNGHVHPISHIAGWYDATSQVEMAEWLQHESERLLAPLDPSPEWQGTLRYNVACHYALSQQSERAVAALREAFELRPDLIEWAQLDPDLDCLRDSPAFKTLIGKS